MDRCAGEEARDLGAVLAPARDGDTEARDAVCALIRPKLTDFVARRLPSWACRWTSPEDVVQDVSIELMKGIGTLPGAPKPEDLWKRAYRIAGLRVRDAVRNHMRLTGESALAAGGPENVAAPSRALGSVTRDDYRRWVRSLVMRLPPIYAEVVRLCALEGLSYEQAAGELGLEVETVRKRYERARKALEQSFSRRRGESNGG